MNNLTDQTFNEAIQSQKPLLVDFWAEWCPPCKAMAPVLEEIAHDLVQVIDVAKLDADAYPTVCQQANVRSLPTLVLYKDGEEVTRIIGAVGLERLRETLAENL